MSCFSITIKPAPPNLNDQRRMHRYQVAREMKNFKEQAGWLLIREKRHWPKFGTPVEIATLRRSCQEMDPSGVIESLKPIVDAMVEVGMIPDDQAANVRYEQPIHVQVPRKQGTELVVFLRTQEAA